MTDDADDVRDIRLMAMSPSDYPTSTWVEALTDLLREYDRRANTIDALTAERDALREALTPSAETKAAYIGEFKTPLTLTRTDGSEYTVHVDVTWTVIKEIMAAIRARAALKGDGE